MIVRDGSDRVLHSRSHKNLEGIWSQCRWEGFEVHLPFVKKFLTSVGDLYRLTTLPHLSHRPEHSVYELSHSIMLASYLLSRFMTSYHRPYPLLPNSSLRSLHELNTVTTNHPYFVLIKGMVAS